MTWGQYIAKEADTHNGFLVRRSYIDITGDFIAGILLGQIVYWHAPDHEGKSKLRIEHKGKEVLAKNQSDWWYEIRITVKQYKRAIKILEDRGFVRVINGGFAGKKTPHIRLNKKKLMRKSEDHFNKITKPISTNRTNPISTKSTNCEGGISTKSTNPIQRLHNKDYNLSRDKARDSDTAFDPFKPNNKKCKRSKGFKHASKLYKVLKAHNKVFRKPNFNSWCKTMAKLQSEIEDPKIISKAIEWYDKNIGGEYVPDVCSAGTFYEKYEKVIAAMERSADDDKQKPVDTLSREEHDYWAIVMGFRDGDLGKAKKRMDAAKKREKAKHA